MGSPFLDYYRYALSLSDEDFNEFSAACHQPLPVTLRIEDERIRDFIVEHFTGSLKVHTFFAPNDVFQLDPDEFKASPIKSAVFALTEAGLLYRQEVVSMLPVFFLKIEQHHTVLDMCAAPGSKTTQILQILKNGTGMLVSNDVNPRRCSVLSMHAKRYCCSSHLVTANDARFFPKMLFDRVLCDVPCSGDGTVRKSPGKLQRWKIDGIKGLGALQYSILKRGLELIKEDGILCYSTCSLNPFENEAIVQRALEDLDCELIDLPKIPGLFKTRSGLVTWTIPENILVEDWMHPKKLNIGLEKCVRVLPQDNNTGGFFLAMFRKKQAHAEICLRLSNDNQAGISLGFDGRLTKNFLQAGFHIRDLETNQETGFSLKAEVQKDDENLENTDMTHNIISSETQKSYQQNEDTSRKCDDQQIHNRKHTENGLGKNKASCTQKNQYNGNYHRLDINRDDTLNQTITSTPENHKEKKERVSSDVGAQSTQIVDKECEIIKKKHSSTSMINSEYETSQIVDDECEIMEKRYSAMSNTNSQFETDRTFLRSLVCKDNLYEIHDSLKKQIEQCFDIKITDKLISHSKTSNKVSIVSEKIHEILRTNGNALRVVSAGALAFNENNLRVYDTSFRAYRGILEKYGYRGDVIKLNEVETRCVIENQSITNLDLKSHVLKKGVGVFELHNVVGLFCGQIFENTTTLYISKKMRNAIKLLITK